MEHDHHHSGRTPPPACSETIAQCLKMVMSLSANDLAQPSSRSALRALRDTIDALLKKHEEVVPSPDVFHERGSTNVSSHASRAFFTEEEIESEIASDSTTAGVESRVWRSRRKSSQEKEEKRARLEKREEILRNLRNAVSEFKAEKNEDASVTTSFVSSQPEIDPLDKFEMRRQRASFWPQGSKEWARQLLGVELGMDANEKRQCYLEMVKACHPDHNQNIAPDAIQLINAAWEVLR